MLNEVSQSIEEECTKRLEILFRESNTWLHQAAYNITKNAEDAEDLVQEVYEYLHKKKNPKLWYKNSYNLLYLHKFLTHRWINKTKKLNRISYVGEVWHEEPEEVYDMDLDLGIMKAYDDVMSELSRLEKTKMWASSKIYSLYWCSEDNLQDVADKIGISKSTVFISIKKIRKHLKGVIENPFE